MPDEYESRKLVDEFHDFIRDSGFVCVGAKSALARDNIRTYVARDINSAWDDVAIYRQLIEFAHNYSAERELFQSFVVLFENSRDLSEQEFEKALWSRVQSLSDKDALHGQDYDSRVSSDPEDPHFSLSFGGEGFFVVGLHPRASRAARRFSCAALVFNLHDQFELLRDAGKYEKMRDAILSRDEKVNGSINPMLSRHGESSEAKQYSGRRVGQEWRCPFDPEQRKSYDAF
ncbi:MAG: YqcI/YcgG family protein [Beijerinckiaceae bacterium]|nr:YqcI/YcgG family protein [Beijerinckiaceae bacterium]MDO9442395.1 guanitoxin biosynthesis heme-dependent pre-guanitoxin N-hydroxylase GntA [Beijerinckiaceae bacterium]